MQGKPYNQSVEVKVTEDDEPAIRERLAERAQTMRVMREPLLG
jgi:hypothetical protein